jgi:hypothetical protein
LEFFHQQTCSLSHCLWGSQFETADFFAFYSAVQEGV